MARGDPQINMRIPAKLKELLEEAAWFNRRSVTAEVVDRLERSFDLHQGKPRATEEPTAYSLPASDAKKVRRLLLEALNEIAPESEAQPRKPRRATKKKPVKSGQEKRP